MAVHNEQEKAIMRMAGLKKNIVNPRTKESKAPYLPYTLKTKKLQQNRKICSKLLILFLIRNMI